MIQKIALALMITFLLLTPHQGAPGNALAAQSADLAIFSPMPGQAVQGLVPIIGSVGLEGMRSFQLTFAFAEDATQTWFLITQGDTPVSQGILGEWDTTVLTDSTYHLKLEVIQQNGSSSEIIVENLRVRNYTAIETSTPAPTGQITSQQLTETAAAVPREQPTMPPFPTEVDINPASLEPANITQAVKRGGIFGAILIVALLLALRLKSEND